MARRRTSDSAVADYQATIRYRLSSPSAGAPGHGASTAVEEQVARIQWQQPNDLRIDVIGRRFRTRRRTRAVEHIGPSLVRATRGGRLGPDLQRRFPATGALHPLAPAGPDWYRYALTGDLTVTRPGAEPTASRVQVTPRRSGPALIAGQMWIDSATAQVVRLTSGISGRHCGCGPSPDHAVPTPPRPVGSTHRQSHREHRCRSRVWAAGGPILDAVPPGDRRTDPDPLVSNVVIPFQATTTFDDYAINTGRAIAFEVPLPDSAGLSQDSVRAFAPAPEDSLRAERRGGHGGVDSLRAWDYAIGGPGAATSCTVPRTRRWTGTGLAGLASRSIPTRRTRAACARRKPSSPVSAETLPDSLTGVEAHGFAYERLSDALRYDRVQGLSLGLGYRVRMPGSNSPICTGPYGMGSATNE